MIAFVGVEKDKKDGTPGKEVTLWQIKDGMIVGGGPASHIFTEIEAEDFHYRVEAKINDKGNSGQYFRTKFGPGFPQGYEAQINATGGDAIKTGSLYPDGRTKLDEFRKDICVMNTAPHKPDEFFTQEVIAEGEPHPDPRQRQEDGGLQGPEQDVHEGPLRAAGPRPRQRDDVQEGRVQADQEVRV